MAKSLGLLFDENKSVSVLLILVTLVIVLVWLSWLTMKKSETFIYSPPGYMKAGAQQGLQTLQTQPGDINNRVVYSLDATELQPVVVPPATDGRTGGLYSDVYDHGRPPSEEDLVGVAIAPELSE
jgi:hypothetical protein